MTALILDIATTGRDPTDGEVRRIRADVAAAGFDPNATSRAGSLAHGLLWAGMVVQSYDRLNVTVAHYLRHAVAGQEWPRETTIAEYVSSLRAVIEDQRSGIYLSRYAGVWSVAFVGRTGVWRGIRGNAWTLVEYRPEYGFWVTGFQPRDGLDHVSESVQRTAGRWLREPS